MERVRTLVRHADDYRKLAKTFRDPAVRAQLNELASHCEQIAAEIARTEALKEGLDIRPEPSKRRGD